MELISEVKTFVSIHNGTLTQDRVTILLEKIWLEKKIFFFSYIETTNGKN